MNSTDDRSLGLQNSIQSNPLQNNTQQQQSPIRFFSGHPSYQGNMKEYREKIDKARGQCNNNMNKFINEGGCEGNDKDYCLLLAQKDAQHCRAVVEGGMRDTLKREYDQIKQRIETLEEEKRNLTSDTISMKEYRHLEGELEALKKEKCECEEALWCSDNVGKFDNFPAWAAVVVLILSVLCYIFCYIFKDKIQKILPIFKFKESFFFPALIIFVLFFGPIPGIIISGIQLVSIFSKN